MGKRYADLSELQAAADGQWLEMLSALAPQFAEAARKPGVHVHCPLHGGKHEFRFCKKKGQQVGLSFCTCGTRNGFQLLQEALGLSFIEVKDMVAEYLGLNSVNSEVRRQKIEAAKVRSNMLRVEREIRIEAEDQQICEKLSRTWNGCVKLDDERAKLGRRYLHMRKLDPAKASGFLRFHPSLPLMDEEGEFVGHFPALVGKVFSNSGTPITLHRTYLDPVTGKKLQGKLGKKLMPVPELKGVMHPGRVIPLMTYNREMGILGIAEGIETAMAASSIFSIPCWAVISAGSMTSFIPPSWVRQLVVFADTDCSMTGQTAARELRKRLYDQGFKGKVHLRAPKAPAENQSYDWADAWYEHGSQAWDLRLAL